MTKTPGVIPCAHCKQHALRSSSPRFVAIVAKDRKVVICDRDTGDATRLSGHTDTINLVRFAANDNLLITADRDNRVILRPLDGHTYAETIVDIELADEEVDMPTLAPGDELS